MRHSDLPIFTRKLISAHGLVGMLSAALEQLEYCYELTDEKDAWMVRDSEDVSLHHDACVHLHRIYTKLAISALEDGDPDTSVNYYLKAYNAAREGPCVVNSPPVAPNSLRGKGRQYPSNEEHYVQPFHFM